MPSQTSLVEGLNIDVEVRMGSDESSIQLLDRHGVISVERGTYIRRDEAKGSIDAVMIFLTLLVAKKEGQGSKGRVFRDCRLMLATVQGANYDDLKNGTEGDHVGNHAGYGPICS
jgi:hypothetical protein